ncbi:MAG: Dihydrodipicolinate reductase [Micavibrio sp.]|nr:Dihydrodipicolinate reductase [Micavibrio sp.]
MKIAIAGYKGRMGQMLVRELESGAYPGLSFFGGTVSSDNPENLFDADAVIDFTTPEATRKHIWLAAKHHKPIVIGTTGMNEQDLNEMHDAAAECALLYSANMSVGVNLLAALVEQASSRLADFDIEILETHHRNKVDAPSGTALMLGKATGRSAAAIDRSGKRAAGTLGYAVQRGGDVAGEHSVSFFGTGERLELSHRAHDRSLFAKGAIRAAQWLTEKPHGFYSMRDMLGL